MISEAAKNYNDTLILRTPSAEVPIKCVMNMIEIIVNYGVSITSLARRFDRAN